MRIILRGRLSNREGIGAKILVTTSGETQRRDVTRSGSYCSSSDVRVHVGLGNAKKVDKITVIWPNGTKQELANVSTNQQILIDEGSDDWHPMSSISPEP